MTMETQTPSEIKSCPAKIPAEDRSMRWFRLRFIPLFPLLFLLGTASAQSPTTAQSDKPPATAQPPELQTAKAQTLLHQGDLDGAFDAVDAALKANPDSPAANLVMGQILFRRGDIAQANESIQKTLKLQPDNPQAWLALSQVAQVVSLRKKAIACVEKAHSIAPDSPAVMLAWANTRPNRAEQIAGFQQYLQDEKKRNGPELTWVTKRIEDLKSLGYLETDVLVSLVAHYDVPIDYILRDSTHLQGWGVKVAIGTCKSVKLMIDTGSPVILIGNSLAEKCGVRKLYTGFITGLGSKPPVGIYTGLADHLQIGPVEFKNVLIDVEERTPVGDEAGIIGPSLLANFLLNLNLNDYKLTLDPLPAIPGDDGKPGPKDRYIAPEMASYAKVFEVQSHLMIPTKVGNDTKPVLFAIDTGSSNNFIAKEYVAKLEKLTEERYYRVKGLRGEAAQVFSADDLTLQFVGFRQMNQRLIANNMANLGGEVQLSGLLGLPILRWFTLHIDYRDGLVGFEYHEPTGLNPNRLR